MGKGGVGVVAKTMTFQLARVGLILFGAFNTQRSEQKRLILERITQESLALQRKHHGRLYRWYIGPSDFDPDACTLSGTLNRVLAKKQQTWDDVQRTNQSIIIPNATTGTCEFFLDFDAGYAMIQTSNDVQTPFSAFEGILQQYVDLRGIVTVGPVSKTVDIMQAIRKLKDIDFVQIDLKRSNPRPLPNLIGQIEKEILEYGNAEQLRITEKGKNIHVEGTLTEEAVAKAAGGEGIATARGVDVDTGEKTTVRSDAFQIKRIVEAEVGDDGQIDRRNLAKKVFAALAALVAEIKGREKK